MANDELTFLSTKQDLGVVKTEMLKQKLELLSALECSAYETQKTVKRWIMMGTLLLSALLILSKLS